MKRSPQTLIEAIGFFSDEQDAFEFVRDLRWPQGVTCPRCGSKEHSFVSTRRVWKCKGCKKGFSVKVGTVFEDSPIGLGSWLSAMWLLANCKNGVSSYELHRALGVTQKTAWFMLHRIRLVLQQGTIEKLSGHVEADETYIGGKARNMHKHRRPGKPGPIGKTIVMGFIQRGGKAITLRIEGTDRKLMEGVMVQHVEENSNLYTDAHGSYRFMDQWYKHQVIDHAVAYVQGEVHTNSLENYWSLLKRTIGGTYVSVEPFHLFRYLDEQAFRFNERKSTDGDRFKLAVSQIAGKRLTYVSLTGKNLPAAGL